jgi:superfamily II DNA or RNA helicase
MSTSYLLKKADIITHRLRLFERKVMQMQIDVSNKIRVKDGKSGALMRWCKENLVVDNPDFYKKQQMGKWTGNTPQTICLYETLGNDVILPFGCLKDLWRMFERSVTWNVKFGDLRRFNYDSHINLYEYQESAVKRALEAKNGILVMPCGAGKTQTGLEVIARVGGRTLWITHTEKLLKQSKERAQVVFGNVGVGTITVGKVDLGQGVTFATVQTLSRVNLAEYRDYWDVIIIDECQHCCGSPTRITQFYKVISSLSARYKIGLTATPYRADGLERCMFALLGDIIHEVKKSDIETFICPVKVVPIMTGWIPDYDEILMGDGTIDYMKLVQNMTHDEERYNFVMTEIISLKGSMIILANRVEYLKKMCDDLKECGRRCICLSGASQNKKAKEARDKALKQLNDGKIDCILATYQLAREGLDVPNLRYVAFVTPEKDRTTVIQSVGRVGRKAKGKEFGTVIDFVDAFGLHKRWFVKRKGYYKEIGAEVIG